MRIELSLSPFDAGWDQLVDAAGTADELGVSGLWMMDHLTGAVHERGHVLECFGVLGGLATVTSRCRLGTLVVNCGLRPVAVLAQSAATIAHQSGGRFVLGLGAGGGAGTPYAAEMEAAGLGHAPDPIRRGRVEDTIGALDHLWGDRPGAYEGDELRVGASEGFLHPDPPPPLLVGGFGPKMAALAGRHGAAFNTHADHPSLASLASVARDEAATAGHRRVEITVFDLVDDDWFQRTSPRRQRLEASGVDTLILVLAPPFDSEVIRRAAESA